MRTGPCLALTLFLACEGFRDPGSEIAAILSKRPASFTDRMMALDRLASRDFPAPGPTAPVADTLVRWRTRLLDGGFTALPESLKAEALIRFLFDSLRLESADDAGELSFSLPSRVVYSRRGSCVGLALVALALAERAGLEARPVLLPGHLFLRLRTGPDSWRNAELLRKGMARPDSFYREKFLLAKRPWYALVSGSPEQALAALAFNLANAHAAAGKTDWARGGYARVAESIPGFPDALGGEGAMLLAEGRGREALSGLEASVAGDSLSFPAWKAYSRALAAAGRIRDAEAAGKRAESLKP